MEKMKTLKERKAEAIRASHVINPEFPREIFIDLTSNCNHSCLFCSNSRIRKKRNMKSEVFEKAIDQAYEYGCRELGLYATGESFLIAELSSYIKKAKAKGFEYIFITTNGSLATPDKAKDVLDAGLDSIKISINAGKRETYKKLHGKDHFDIVINNLKWISRYREVSGLDYKIYVTMVYTNETKDEVETLRKLVTQYIDEWDPHTLNNQCGNKYDNNEIGNIEEGNIRSRTKSEICFQPFKSFTVTPEGYISACVLDYQKYLIVGDINKNNLLEIWNCDLYRKFRKMHIERKIEKFICYNCINNKNIKVKPLNKIYAEPLNTNTSKSRG